MYININTNQYPVTESEIRSSHPDTSFPQPFTPPDGYSWVFPAPPPTHNPVVERVVETVPELTPKGHWEQRWNVVPKFVEYTDEAGVTHTVMEQEQQALDLYNLQTQEALYNSVVQSTQTRLDDFAKTRGYDSMLSCTTYVTSGVSKFQVEAAYCVTARDLTWSKLYSILQEITDKTRPLPSSYQDIEPELPVLTWPN